jgi:hypothetical protein
MEELELTNDSIEYLEKIVRNKKQKFLLYQSKFNENLFSFFEEFFTTYFNSFSYGLRRIKIGKDYRLVSYYNLEKGFVFRIFYKWKIILIINKDCGNIMTKNNYKYASNLKELIEYMKVEKEELLKQKLYTLDIDLALIEELGNLPIKKETPPKLPSSNDLLIQRRKERFNIGD